MTVDLFSASDRGPAIDLYLAAVFASPCSGPVTGGFVVDKLGLAMDYLTCPDLRLDVLHHCFPCYSRDLRSGPPPT
jgi:hypothetical protein